MYETHAPAPPKVDAVKFDELSMAFNVLTCLCIISTPFIFIFMDRLVHTRIVE